MLWRTRKPETQAELDPGRFYRFWRWTKRIVAALAVMLAVGLLAGPSITHHLVEQERERIRAAGEPLTCADLARMQTLPPGTANAADIYRQAFDTLDRTEEEGELIGRRREESARPEWIEAIRPVVAKNGRYFALLEEAADIDDCVFPVEWEKRADAVQPHLAGVRNAARMLIARALVFAADGKGDESLTSCGLIAVMVQQLSGEPVIISQLVRYALLGIGKQGVEQVLNRCDPSAKACRDLYEAFGEVELSESLLHAAKGERAWARESAFDQAREATSGATGWAGAVIESQLNNDERVYLRVMREQMEALELPWPEAKQRAEAIVDRFLGAPDWVYLTADAVIPALGPLAESCRLADGRRDVCRIGLALKAYQTEHGRYPDSLEELAAAEFRRWAELGPESTDAFFGLGQCCYNLGEYEEAKGAFLRALDHSPDHRRALLGLAYALAKTGDYAAARERLHRVVEIDPDSEEAREAQSILRKLEGKSAQPEETPAQAAPSP